MKVVDLNYSYLHSDQQIVMIWFLFFFFFFFGRWGYYRCQRIICLRSFEHKWKNHWLTSGRILWWNWSCRGFYHGDIVWITYKAVSYMQAMTTFWEMQQWYQKGHFSNLIIIERREEMRKKGVMSAQISRVIENM